MGTTIRAEISKKSANWIDKHRYYELKHFCLQYPIWRQAYSLIDGFSKRPVDPVVLSKTNINSDPTGRSVEVKCLYFAKMEMVEQAAIKADPSLASYILKAVTEGRSYDYLKSRLDIPCSKDTYYERYRRFFKILSEVRE